MLSANEAADFFLALSTHDQAGLLRSSAPERSRPVAALLAPDDAADVIQSMRRDERAGLLALLDQPRAAR